MNNFDVFNEQVKVGAECVVLRGHNFRPEFGWKVTKVTATGQVTVAKEFTDAERPDTNKTLERRFKPNRWDVYMEFGRMSKYSKDRLSFDVDGIRARQDIEARRHRAAELLRAVAKEAHGGDSWSKDNMLDQVCRLEAAVAEARKAVEAI